MGSHHQPGRAAQQVRPLHCTLTCAAWPLPQQVSVSPRCCCPNCRTEWEILDLVRTQQTSPLFHPNLHLELHSLLGLCMSRPTGGYARLETAELNCAIEVMGARCGRTAPCMRRPLLARRMMW